MTPGDLLKMFSGLRALVVGDLMLDEYLIGSATRISPEAPVMVIHHRETKRVPGGAANVARNIAALGGKPHLIGVAGNDETGGFLELALQESGTGSYALVRDPKRRTTRKTRVLANPAHQVVRIDQEDDDPIGPAVDAELCKTIFDALGDAEVVILSDYLKGTLTAGTCAAVINRAHELGIPVVVNPKPRSISHFAGADLISLNRAEASEAVGRVRALPNEEAFAAASQIRSKVQAKGVLVTLGEAGMVAAVPDEIHVDAPRVEVADPAGAGDTVIATVAMGVASVGIHERAVYEAAALMAAAVVQHVGVAAPSLEDIRRVE